MWMTRQNKDPGPSLTIAIWRCRNPFSQWQCSFQKKLHPHWLKFLRQRHVAVIRLGLGHKQSAIISYLSFHCWSVKSKLISFLQQWSNKTGIFMMPQQLPMFPHILKVSSLFTGDRYNKIITCVLQRIVLNRIDQNDYWYDCIAKLKCN